MTNKKLQVDEKLSKREKIFMSVCKSVKFYSVAQYLFNGVWFYKKWIQFQSSYTNLKAVGSYYVLTLDGGIFNHFGTKKERNLGLDKVTFSGKSLSPILKMAMRGRPMFILKTGYNFAKK